MLQQQRSLRTYKIKRYRHNSSARPAADTTFQFNALSASTREFLETTFSMWPGLSFTNTFLSHYF